VPNKSNFAPRGSSAEITRDAARENLEVAAEQRGHADRDALKIN